MPLTAEQLMQEIEKGQAVSRATREAEQAASAKEKEAKPLTARDITTKPLSTAGEEFQVLDDAVRTMAGPAGDLLAGYMNETGSQAESELTAEARERLGPAGTPLAVGGQIAQAMAITPGMALATIPRAMGAGAGVSTILNSAEELSEEGELPSMGETGAVATGGALGGMFGNIIGRTMGAIVGKITDGKRALSSQTMQYMNRMKNTADQAGKSMDKAGVIISNKSFQRLQMRMMNQLEKQGLSPEGTPKAWQAFNVFRSMVGRGENQNLRQLNTIRQAMREALPPGASGTEARLVRDMDKMMRQYIESLMKAKPGNAIIAGDTKQGVEAWKQMNVFHQEALKTETLANIFARAENAAISARAPFDRALQQEVGKLFQHTKKSDKLLNQFSPAQQKMLQKLADGDTSTRLLNRLDKTLGHGLFSMVYNTMRAAPRALASEAAAAKASNISSIVGGMAEPGRAIPNLSTMLGIQGGAGIIEGQNAQNQPPMSAPPSAPMSVRPPKPLTPQSQSALPQFPRVPGVTKG